MNEPNWTIETVQAAIEAAQKGDQAAFDQLQVYLYEHTKTALLKQQLPADKAERFAWDATEIFKTKFVKKGGAFAVKNWKGYVFSIARNLWLAEQKRPKVVQAKGQLPDTASENVDHLVQAEEKQYKDIVAEALRLAISRLTDICKTLYSTMMEQDEYRPRELTKILGWKSARQVTVRLDNCKPQLKRKHAIAIEELLDQNNLKE